MVMMAAACWCLLLNFLFNAPTCRGAPAHAKVDYEGGSLRPSLCPLQCSRSGACKLGACRCYVGFEGVACDRRVSGVLSLATQPPLPSESRRRALRIVVVTIAHARATTADDADAVFPGVATAHVLAAAGHHVRVVAHASGQVAAARETAWREYATKQLGIAAFELLHTTRHYYLPTHNVRAYESFAWLHDDSLRGEPRADVVFFHDGHGAAYYSALARVQAHGLLRTTLVCRLETPHLWLQRHGGGGGATSIDDLEATFLERESMRLCDVPLVGDRSTYEWTRKRRWNTTAVPYVLPRPLPPDDDVSSSDVAWSKPGAGLGVEVVFVIEGPGGGDTGAGVSAGKNDEQEQSTAHDPPPEQLERASRNGVPGTRRLSLGAGDGSRFVLADTAAAARAAVAVASALAHEAGDNAVREVVFLMLGQDGVGHDAATRFVEESAARNAWPFTWRVMRGRTRDAVSYFVRTPRTPESASPEGSGALEFDIGASGRKAARRRVAVVIARRFRGASTPALARRLARVEARLRHATASKAPRDDPMRLVIVSEGRAADAVRIAVGASARVVDTADDDALATAVRKEIVSPDLAGIEAIGREAELENRLVGLFDSLVDGERSHDLKSSNSVSEGAFGAAMHVAQLAAASIGGAFPSAISSNVVSPDVASPDTWWSGGVHGSPLLPTLNPGGGLDESHWPVVSIVITHYNRPKLLPFAIRSYAEQDYPSEKVQLIVIDDGSSDADVSAALDAIELEWRFAERGWLLLREPNRYLGGARNTAASHAQGEYILFVDDDNIAKPFEVRTFVRAMESSGADVLTSFTDFVWGNDEMTPSGDTAVPMLSVQDTNASAKAKGHFSHSTPGFVFLGGSPEAGLFKNGFGDANCFVRTATFLSLGGYTTDRGIGYEDWEMYAKLSLGGYELQVVPYALYHYRFTGGASMQKSTSYSRSRRRALRPYVDRTTNHAIANKDSQ
ncbi:glycosyltransferase [Pycnococcus provasolii]